MEGDIDPWIARLIAAHPQIFRGRPPAEASNLSPGWFILVDKLCSDIESVLGNEGLKQFECLQIKEKFGTLRFYWRHGYLGFPRVDLTDPGDIASFEASSAESDRRLELLARLVDDACSASAFTCDMCGNLGTLVAQSGRRMIRCIEHTPPWTIRKSNDGRGCHGSDRSLS